MYVTRPLSQFIRDPSALSLLPPEGPNSGILVIQDEEAVPTWFFGLLKSRQLERMPLPQDKNLILSYWATRFDPKFIFIPVLNQPLSSNQYYWIEGRGKLRGKAYRNLRKEDTYSYIVRDLNKIKPDTFDYQDIYQRFKIERHRFNFEAKSVVPNGLIPHPLAGRWNLFTSAPLKFELSEANGLDGDLRARLPEFNLSLSDKKSFPVEVGKWHCPFMFIKDGEVKDQVDNSRFYKMTLEQYWEQIFTCENEGNIAVNVDVVVETETVAVRGRQVSDDEKTVDDANRMVSFRSFDGGVEISVGLNLAIVEKIEKDQKQFGWDRSQMRVKREEECGGSDWKKYGCYVLVESYVLTRMEGISLLTFNFRHTKHLKSIWEYN